MDRKAQGGPVSFMFNMLFFLIFIGIIGGTLWAIIGSAAIEAGLTGIEAFIYDNFAMVIILSALLGTMAFFRFGTPT